MSVYSSSPLKNYLGAALSTQKKQKSETARPAVTISRQSGSGALTVANIAARYLDYELRGCPRVPWRVFDRNLVTEILEDHDLSNRIEKFMPENVRFPLSEAFECWLGLHPPGWTLREYAKETIRKLAKRGNVILLGRAGAIVTANVRHVLHVRLIAPLDFRARNYAQLQGMSTEEAARAVRANDKANYHFVRSYFNTNVSAVTLRPSY